MDSVSQSLTPLEVTKLCDDFIDYPYVVRTIRYFSSNLAILRIEAARLEATAYLRELQEIANKLAIGEADAKN